MAPNYRVALSFFLVFSPFLIFLNTYHETQEKTDTKQLPSPTDLPITSDPIISLSYLASLPPPSPPSPTCVPPGPLPPPLSCDAARNPGLSGKLLTRPRAVVMMIMFGFEVDTLEIALREQLDYVDTIFIIESTVNQKGVRSFINNYLIHFIHSLRDPSHCFGRE